MENYIFNMGWTRNSIDMEKFLREKNVRYALIHQELGEQGSVVSPSGELYAEEDFYKLREILSKAE